jgi:hypothetical protein
MAASAGEPAADRLNRRIIVRQQHVGGFGERVHGAAQI